MEEPMKDDDVEKKLAAIRAAVAHNVGPGAESDVDTMLAEIEQGYANADLDSGATTPEGES